MKCVGRKPNSERWLEESAEGMLTEMARGVLIHGVSAGEDHFVDQIAEGGGDCLVEKNHSLIE